MIKKRKEDKTGERSIKFVKVTAKRDTPSKFGDIRVATEMWYHASGSKAQRDHIYTKLIHPDFTTWATHFTRFDKTYLAGLKRGDVINDVVSTMYQALTKYVPRPGNAWSYWNTVARRNAWYVVQLQTSHKIDNLIFSIDDSSEDEFIDDNIQSSYEDIRLLAARDLDPELVTAIERLESRRFESTALTKTAIDDIVQELRSSSIIDKKPTRREVINRIAALKHALGVI